jgi:hypothetical protein
LSHPIFELHKFITKFRICDNSFESE